MTPGTLPPPCMLHVQAYIADLMCMHGLSSNTAAIFYYRFDSFPYWNLILFIYHPFSFSVAYHNTTLPRCKPSTFSMYCQCDLASALASAEA